MQKDWASVPIPVLSFLLLLPNIPLSANWGVVTLVSFCQPEAGLRPSRHKTTSEEVHIKPKVEEQLLVKGAFSFSYSAKSSQKRLYETKAELKLLN